MPCHGRLFARPVSAAVALAFLLACGGGGGGSSTPAPAPQWTSTPGTAATEAHTYSYTASASNPHSGTLTYKLVSSPSGASLTGSRIDWIPSNSQVGAGQAFHLQVSDGTTTVDQSWTVMVTPNAAPAFTSQAPGNGLEAHPYAYALAAADADGDTVQYSATNLPGNAALNGNQITWTPAATDAGHSASFTVTASDGHGGHTDQSWSVTVAPNAAPLFMSHAPANAIEEHLYAYALAATDADGDPVQFRAKNLPINAAFNGNQVTWTPTAADVGHAVSFTITASDGLGGQTDQTWSVTPAPNALPTFTSQPPDDVSFVQSAPVFDYGVSCSDADGDLVTFTLVQAPTGATLVNGILHWQPTPDQERVPQTFQIRASDGHGGIKDQVWTKAYSGVLRGTWADTYQSASGTLTQKTDSLLSSYSLSGLVPDGADGFRTLYGTWNPDGTLLLPGIPPGHYWLRAGSRGYLWTDQGNLDLGKLFLGRADAVPGNDAASISLNMTGLDPWFEGIGVRWIVPNHGNNWFLSQGGFSDHAPVNGDTALANTVMPRLPYTPLVDATKGDQLWLVQPQFSFLGGLGVYAVSKAFTTDSFIQVAGQINALNGTFTEPPQFSANVVWDLPTVALYKDQIHPGATSNHTLFIAAQPGGQSAGLAQSAAGAQDYFEWNYPSLLFAFGTPGTFYQETLTAGDPFPDAWTRFYISSHGFNWDINFNSVSGTMGGRSLTLSESPGTVDQPLGILVSPAQNPTINGLNFLIDQTGVGVTPSISWKAPVLGEVSYYRILLGELTANPSGISVGATTGTDLIVFGNSVQIPPGLLQNGRSYLITIRAVSSGAKTPAQAPFRFGLPFGYTDCVSGVITP